MQTLSKTILKNKKELVTVGAVFLLALFLRTLKLNEHLFFGFEQGRDAYRVMDIIHGKDLFLVGPKTDIGGIFHGAWYYYLLVLPYFLGQGDPLFSAYFLAILGSLVPVFFYLLLKDMRLTFTTRLIGALLVAVSFDAISYSRWLSNVSLAYLMVTLSFYFLYKTISSSNKGRSGWYLVLSFMSAGLASQFEIILSIFYPLAYFLSFLVFSKLKRVSLKYWLAGVVGYSVFFLPFLVFNLKNNWITLLSLKLYFSKSHSDFSFWPGIYSYIVAQKKLIQNSFLNRFVSKDIVFVLMFLTSAVSVFLFVKNDEYRDRFKLFFIWWLMTVPLLLFPNFSNLDQLYVGTSLGFLGLCLLVFDIAFSRTKNLLTKLVFVFLSTLVFFNFLTSFKLIWNNQGMFFITIQDGLNYKDQTDLIKYVVKDKTKGDKKFKAFAIPYYHEEGWQYLLERFNGSAMNSLNPKYIYLAIEKNVDPFWRQKWTNDLGKTKLVEQKHFGLLTLEKREVLK